MNIVQRLQQIDQLLAQDLQQSARYYIQDLIESLKRNETEWTAVLISYPCFEELNDMLRDGWQVVSIDFTVPPWRGEHKARVILLREKV